MASNRAPMSRQLRLSFKHSCTCRQSAPRRGHRQNDGTGRNEAQRPTLLPEKRIQLSRSKTRQQFHRRRRPVRQTSAKASTGDLRRWGAVLAERGGGAVPLDVRGGPGGRETSRCSGGFGSIRFLTLSKAVAVDPADESTFQGRRLRESAWIRTHLR